MFYPKIQGIWDKYKKVRDAPVGIAAPLILLYIALPLYLAGHFEHLPPRPLAAFYLLNALLTAYLLKKKNKIKHELERKKEALQEEINILYNGISGARNAGLALQQKIKRYNSLKNIIEEINRDLTLGAIADDLTSIAFSLITNNKGTCILYLVDSQNQVALSLFKAKKENNKLVIKAKQGDIFDVWVLRHTTPLLIEDIKKDFRFDLEILRSQEVRPIASLISAPFISGRRFLGMLRLDSPIAYFYSQDDLRFLMTISEIGAVALENSELFRKTQDLATHDELTSFYTKGFFLERLKEESQRSARQKKPFALLILDIDYFKDYNDRFGHTAGDMVLKSLSQAMLESLKDLDPVISRFGGEEFCIILPDTAKARAQEVAGELLTKIARTKVTLRRQETSVTVSIGIAGFPADTYDANELIIKADRAMYEAKQKGRNRVCSA